MLAAAGVGLPLGELRDRGVTADVLAGWPRAGWSRLRDEADERDPFERCGHARRQCRDPTRELTPEQRAAFDQLVALADAGEFRVALLHGVTGSGKTEIYLRLAQHVQSRWPAGAAAWSPRSR